MLKNVSGEDQIRCLNVGCGTKFHHDWVNIDMASYSPMVKKVNLLKGIPFPDNSFDAVYHSQVLEHIPKENAQQFIKECLRVLKPNGILRVVTPDFENMVDEYKRLLLQNLAAPTDTSKANYEWIMLEILDQIVRTQSGGLMAKYLQQPSMINEQYVMERIGFVGANFRKGYLKMALSSATMFRKAVSFVLHKIETKLFWSKAKEIGKFRLSGEVHTWMYDRYSLSELLKICGFMDIVVKTPFESAIPQWSKYELDVKNGQVYDPTSLFVEGRKRQ
jgi:predicted SAM-dependent methyltransferase